MSEQSQTAPATAGFKSSFDSKNNRVQLVIEPGFQLQQWSGIEQYSNTQIEEGHLAWLVDLSALESLTSRLLGLLIGLNTRLMCRGGSLCLRFKRDSRVGEFLKHSRMNAVMDFEYAGEAVPPPAE